MTTQTVGWVTTQTVGWVTTQTVGSVVDATELAGSIIDRSPPFLRTAAAVRSVWSVSGSGAGGERE